MKPTLRNFTILALALWSFTAQAAPGKKDLNFLPEASAPQKEFKSLVSANDFTKALSVWNSAVASSPFGQSASGYAFYSYLLFRSGLEVTGVEHLFLLKNPGSISPEVRKLWQQAAGPTHSVWKLAQLRWNSAWTQVFAGFSGLENSPFQSESLTSAQQLAKLEAKVAAAKVNSNEKAWAQWQLALWAAQFNKTALAKAQLDSILKSKQSVFDRDQLRVAKARILYQEGKLKEALNEYLPISKGSDYWLESLEERAWTYVRLGQPDRALGELRTLLSPVFAPQVGPEPLFLQAFINLKVCDYPQIFRTIQDFKKRYRARANEIQALAQTGQTPQAEQAIAKLDKSTLSWNSVGANSASLPRYFHRDEIIAKELGLRLSLLRDQEALSALEKKNPSAFAGGGLAVDNLKKQMANVPMRTEQARVQTFKRLKVLAKVEFDEIADNLQKMHIIEAEATARMHRVQQAHFKGSVKKSVTHKDDELVFPVDAKNDELWVDELDKFRYEVRGCPNQGEKNL